MSENGRFLDAPGFQARVTDGGITARMDGDGDGEVLITGPTEAGEVYDGKVYRLEFTAEQSGVTSEVATFIPADQLEAFVGGDA